MTCWPLRADEAIAMARFQWFDLLISDLRLPELAGRNFLKELRKAHPRLRAIAAGGPSVQTVREQFAESGFDRYHVGPIEEPGLKQAIAELFP